MKRLYTEQDLVLKHSELGGLLQEAQSYGILTPEQRRELVRLLEQASGTGAILEFPDVNGHAWVDKESGEFVLVLHNVYDPRNLLTTLFDRLTSVEWEDPEKDKQHALGLIDSYLGAIEKRERIDLTETKRKLRELISSLKNTMPLFGGEEFTDRDLQKLSEALDKAYFEPISELLEGVLVNIAGN